MMFFNCVLKYDVTFNDEMTTKKILSKKVISAKMTWLSNFLLLPQKQRKHLLIPTLHLLQRQLGAATGFRFDFSPKLKRSKKIDERYFQQQKSQGWRALKTVEVVRQHFLNS